MDFDEEFKESQRVAELAGHLLKTGTAASSAEAEKRAREMIYGSVAATATKPAAQENVKTNSDEYIKMIETSHNLIMKELAAIKYKQDQFISEILTLKSELSRMQIQAVAASRQIQAPVQAAETRTETPREAKQDAAPAAQPAQQAAPKKNPDDISIEKYFYFGQKK